MSAKGQNPLNGMLDRAEAGFLFDGVTELRLGQGARRQAQGGRASRACDLGSINALHSYKGSINRASPPCDGRGDGGTQSPGLPRRSTKFTKGAGKSRRKDGGRNILNGESADRGRRGRRGRGHNSGLPQTSTRFAKGSAGRKGGAEISRKPDSDKSRAGVYDLEQKDQVDLSVVSA